MANASATPKTPRRRRRVTFLARTCHRLLRLLATHRLRRGGHGLNSISAGDDSPPSGQPPRGRDAEEAEATQACGGGATAARGATRRRRRRRHRGGGGGRGGEVLGAAAQPLLPLRPRAFELTRRAGTPPPQEPIAAAQAARAPPGSLVLDAFAGVGGNSIQGCYVVAVEIDPRKVELAAHNARIYGVDDMIEFVVADFFHLAPSLKADLGFLLPPWGGPSYSQAQVYSLDMLKPRDGFTIFQAAQEISPNIIMFLPRNVDLSQVEQLSWLSSPPLDFVSEENYIEHRFKGITAYFGGLAQEVLKQG
ncbi:hypothetical protein OsJ_20390 [Oryza sativa Japonica Group]|uniref:Trimethylguanosine synthase n=1 Tax=Oryza sativa subsp. japonica TaxID=39947 RepID=B9FRX0_ORYSJ|nr:hypothetical protein OsJ_20390 [Oryza sativa Japonica Group]